MPRRPPERPLHDAFRGVWGLSEVVSYTASDNLRSQAVMKASALAARSITRLHRELPRPSEIWHGLVWVGRPA